MENRVLTVFCTLISTLGFVLSTQGQRSHTGLERSSPLRNLTFSHRSRYSLYMMQLYRSFRNADSFASVSVNDVTAQSNNPPYRANSVLSLMAKGCHQVGEKWTVTFDFLSVSAGEFMQLAELRIGLSAFLASKHATVDLYHSQKQSCGLGSTSCQEEPLFLGSFNTSLNSTKSSWKVFNVTALLKYWLYQSDRVSNQEASGEYGPEHGSGAGEEREETHMSVFKHLELRQRQRKIQAMNRVMMVIFSKPNVAQEGHSAYSIIYTVEKSKYVTTDKSSNDSPSRRHKRNRMEPLIMVNGAPPTAEPVHRPLCRKVDMWVDSDHIGWDEWIVHHNRFNAYRCEGECPTPLDDSFSPTNHAYMQVRWYFNVISLNFFKTLNNHK
uniref:Southpaw n=1 Tax=Cynoglossus semilaevis TaxID=244447 RepID=A0A3P8W8Z9_CYNSE